MDTHNLWCGRSWHFIPEVYCITHQFVHEDMLKRGMNVHPVMVNKTPPGKHSQTAVTVHNISAVQLSSPLSIGKSVDYNPVGRSADIQMTSRTIPA